MRTFDYHETRSERIFLIFSPSLSRQLTFLLRFQSKQLLKYFITIHLSKSAMQEFFENVARYPRYLISLILGIFIAAFDSLKPLFSKGPWSAIATIGILLGGFAFMFFTLKAMLGLTST